MAEPNEHLVDQLPRLLTGDATRTEVELAVAHLRECSDCRDMLVDLVAAHAPLASAARFAPEAVRPEAVDVVVPPGVGADKSHGAVDSPEAPLPDLSALFAEARADEASARQRSRGRRGGARLWLVAAAAAGVIVGGGAVVFVHSDSSGSGSGHSVALSAYGIGTTDAAMKVRSSGGDSVLTIDASGLPKLSASQRYEVWLTNAARSAMQPVGWLGADNTVKIAVPANLSAHFTNVEVSVQSMNTPSYAYSGTSVLRGSY